ncbi:hypothetical protein HC928_00560 [bacterium]|nr:hypothetical protein [bacterium]
MSPEPTDHELVEARRQVRAFMQVLDISETDMRQWKEDLRWLQDHRKKFDGMGEKLAASIVGAVGFAAILALWEGFKHLIHK